MAAKKNEKTYETEVNDIQELLKRMEGGNLTLEETKKLYQQAMGMVASMKSKLLGAQEELEEIGAGKQGDPPEQTSMLDGEE